MNKNKNNHPQGNLNEDAISNWGQALKLYSDKRLWRIFGLGMSSGFPWVMIGSAMTAWLVEDGLSRTDIGFFGFIFVAYSINFLWSPLIDRVRIPVLGSSLGQRRSWIIVMQCLIALCCWFIASTSPEQDLSYAKTIAFALALFSATQDISIDAYRIDSIPQEESRLVAAGAAMATAGWWTGFAGLGAIPLLLVDIEGWNWTDVYYLMAMVVLLLALVPLFSPEPISDRVKLQALSGQKYRALLTDGGEKQYLFMSICTVISLLLIAWLIVGLPGVEGEYLEQTTFGVAFLAAGLLAYIISLLAGIERKTHLSTAANSAYASQVDSSNLSNGLHQLIVWVIVSFIEPLAEFFRRNGVQLALSVLLFIFLFKIGEAFLGRMSIVFYKEIGFSNTDIALYSKLVSWWVTILFSLLGSLVTIRYGILKALFVGGIAMAASNLMFALIAMVGPSKIMLVSAVIVDGFTSAWSTVAFVAFLSMMCNRAFTASQYALMASLGTLGRTFVASYSGYIVDKLEGNWTLFFIITAVMVIPSLLLLYRIRHRLRALAAEF